MLNSLLIVLALAGPALAATSLDQGQRWGFGLLTSIGLGLLGFTAAILLVQIRNCMNTGIFKGFIKFFFSLACGTLLGDAVIHILSQAYASQNLNSYYISLIFILSIMAFLGLEKAFMKFGVVHQHWVDDEHDEHQHAHTQNNPSGQVSKKPATPGTSSKIHCLQDTQGHAENQNQIEQFALQDTVRPQAKDVPTEPGCLDSLKGKGSAGYLNLIGSSIHNTIDGLSIGLAFSTGDSTVYIPIVVAIFIHQIPRQLGDVAILLKSKFSGWQTICSNGVINMLAVVGAIIGLSTSQLSEQAKEYIMVFVAGNFVYIASDIWKHLFISDWKGTLIQSIGFVTGVGAMFGIKALQ